MKRALVAGGSLAGLTAGLFLLRAGWDVHVFERSKEDLSDQGGGIVTQEAMWQALAGAGLTRRPGVRLGRRIVYARDGSVLGEHREDETVTSWDALYGLLHDAFPAERYHLGREVESYEETDERVVLRFEDGGGAEGELLVAADGVGSTIRKQMHPEVQPRYVGYVAWRGLVPEGELPAHAREALVDVFSFCNAPHEQMLSYTVPGDDGEEEPGQRRHNFVWYRPAEEKTALQDLLTDEDGETHQPNIPAPKIRPDVIAELRAHAEATLSPAYAAFVRATETPKLQPINDHLCPHLVSPPVLLIGAAAAHARPPTGAGTSKAIGDAAALAAALGETGNVTEALRRYEEARLPIIGEMVEHGRWLGRHLDPAMPGDGTAPGEDQAVDTLLRVAARAKGSKAVDGRAVDGKAA